MIVNAHLHWYPGMEGYDPKTLVESGVIEKAWMLSANAIICKPVKQATDEEVLSLAKGYNGFFIPFAYLDLERDPSIIDELYDQGFAGLKAIWPSEPYDAPSYFPFYEKIESYRMPIVFHVGAPCPYWPPNRLPPGFDIRRTAGKNMKMMTLDLIAKIFPELVMIGAHMGGHRHEYAEGIQIAQVHPNIYLDTSIPLPWFHEGCKRAVYDIPEKLLFGTDYSYDISVEAALQWKYYFRAFYEDKTVGEKILGLNAEKIIADSGWDPSRMLKK